MLEHESKRDFTALIIKPDAYASGFDCFGGERGIRTPGGLTLNGFQDRRNRPLCHLSAAKVVKIDLGWLPKIDSIQG